MRAAVAGALLLAALAGGGCGGSLPKPKLAALTPTPTATPSPSAAPSASATAAPAPSATPVPLPKVRDPVKVARGWARDLRAGRIARANARFAIPATVANGFRPVQLRNATEVDQFNRSLPCGAVATATQRVGRERVIVTFRLTDRRGAKGACGSGVGAPAFVSFRVRDGLIVEWIRVAEPGTPGAREV